MFELAGFAFEWPELLGLCLVFGTALAFSSRLAGAAGPAFFVFLLEGVLGRVAIFAREKKLRER
jgi:hypothetical protein